MRPNFELNKLKSTFFIINVYVKVYSKILRKTKPNYTFQICHYSINSIALSIASYKLNIPTIEIQHGPQPPLHLAYGFWSKVKTGGYNTLPTAFWNWDEYSYNTLNDWLKNHKYHKAFVLGNPWIDYLKPKLKKEKKDYVLYSLQPISFNLLFPPYLISFIKTNSIKWWLRLHPTDFNRKQEYIDFLSQNDLSSYVFFDDGTTYSLPETLAFSKIHITYSSGCTIEAAQFGIQTILLDPSSINYYKELIAQKTAFLAKNENEFTTNFNNILGTKNLMKDTEIIKNYKSVFKELELCLDSK